MTVEWKSRSRRIASQGVAERGTQPRSLAALLTGGAVALALVLGAAMPAKADKKDDLAKALIGALIVGAIVNELNDKPQSPVPQPEPVKHKRVPGVCAITIDGAERSVTLFPESCLRREGFDHRLPRGCANSARIFGRDDRVYSAQCLRDAGYRISGH
ncbi:MAG: hypothetical protein MUE52_21320 [Tabrizicola sp.]|jgi:hypothetical protein|nr:hypothetical protein [Tabrizicola sp.]